MQKKKKIKTIQKNFLVCEIMASEMATVNFLYYKGNNCHGQPIR